MIFPRPNGVNVDGAVAVFNVAVGDDNDDDDDDDVNVDAEKGGVNDPLFNPIPAAAAAAAGPGVVDIDDCMVELRPFGFCCCCFSFSGITILLG